MYNFSYWFLIFLVYSIVGYFIEIILCSFKNKKFVNRGFLFGPYCPIYGTGALLMIWMLNDYKTDSLVVFLLGMLLCSTLEYFTSWIIEKIFHNKWWDYSQYKDSINGRVRLLNSIGFGVGSIFLICFFNPILVEWMKFFNNFWLTTIGFILFIVFIVDYFYSILIAYGFRNRIIIVEELKNQKIAMVPETIKKYVYKQFYKLKITSDRFLRIFPKLINYKEIVLVKDIVEELKVENKIKKKKKRKQKKQAKKKKSK